jgi:hypothetical protein
MGVKLSYKKLCANVAPRKPGRLVDGARTDSEAVALDGSREFAGERGENREERPVTSVCSTAASHWFAETTTRDTPRTVHTEVKSSSSFSGH